VLPEKPDVTACSFSDDCCCKKLEKSNGNAEKTSLLRTVQEGIRYAFGPLLRDLGPYLLAGIALAGLIAWLIPDGFVEQHLGSGITLAGLIAWLIPDGFVEQHLGSGITSMLIMLAAGVPLYVCASASTPIVAALALKGLSPGAALVFLLAGPATNAASITVVAKLLGRPVAAVYVAVIALCALVSGMVVNALYGWLDIDISAWTTGMQHSEGGWFQILAAIALLALIVRSVIKKR
jgi:uncharacterized membrane protein YraQ (UPF0718 family)